MNGGLLKSILWLKLFFLVSFTRAFDQGNSNHCILTGKFSHAFAVNCVIYEIANDSSICFVKELIKLKTFEIKLKKDQNYLLRFTAKNETTKYLQIETNGAGRFAINLDFSTDKNAILSYHSRMRAYHIQVIETSDFYFAGRE